MESLVGPEMPKIEIAKTKDQRKAAEFDSDLKTNEKQERETS
jgi:hypothetical protein